MVLKGPWIEKWTEQDELSTLQTKSSCCCLISSCFLCHFTSCTPDLISPTDTRLFRGDAALCRGSTDTGPPPAGLSLPSQVLASEKSFVFLFLGCFLVFLAKPNQVMVCSGTYLNTVTSSATIICNHSAWTWCAGEPVGSLIGEPDR